MKVRELIEALQKHDPEMMVVVDGYEYGLRDPHPLRVIRIRPDETPTEYGGPYEEADSGEPAVLIPRSAF